MLFQFIINSQNVLLDSDVNDLTVLVFRILFIIAAFLYMLFSIVVVRQISIMRSTLITEFSPLLQLIGLVHLLLSIAVLLFFIISL